MSKNLTRKGIALGAAVALSTTLFAGAPAFAADLTLEQSTGTGYGMISGETFSLTAVLGNSIPTSNASNLKFKITSATAKSLAAVKINNTDLTTSNDVDYASSGSTAEAYTSATSAVFGLSGVTSGPVSVQLQSAADVDGAFTVTAFLDNNNDGETTGETLATQTVTFTKVADLVSSVTVAPVIAGATTADATATITGINVKQIPAAHFGFNFSANGGNAAFVAATDATITTAGVISATSGSFTALTSGQLAKASLVYYNGTANGYTTTSTTTTAASAATTAVVVTSLGAASATTVAGTTTNIVGAKITIPDVTAAGTVASVSTLTITSSATFSVATAGTSFASGAAVTLTRDVALASATVAASAATVASVNATVVAGANAIGTAGANAGTVVNTAGTTETSNVRPNSEYTVKAVVKDGTSATAAALASVPVVATFTSTASTLSAVSGSEKQIIINGTTYSVYSDVTALKLALTTDATGSVSVKINTVGFTTETVTVTFKAQNFSDVAAGTAQAAVYNAIDLNDKANVGTIVLTKGATATVAYQVVDQFKQAPADNTFRIKLAGASNAYQPVVAGKASFTVTGGAATQAYTTSLESYTASTASYDSSYTEGGSHDAGFSVSYAATATDVTVGSITATTAIVAAGQYAAYASTTGTDTASSLTNKNNLIVAGTDFTAVDTRLSATAAPTRFDGYSAVATANGTAGNGAVTMTVIPKASDVAKTAVAASVTVSGKGLLFKVGDVYALDTVTFIAASGGTAVEIYSHKAGANVVTVTSGSATTSVTLGYKALAIQATDVNFAGLSKTTTAGRAFNVKATAVDKWGNAVEGATVTLSTSGDVGYLTNEAAQTTKSNGQVSARLILGASENGVTEVTATLDLATDVVVSQALLVGVSAKITKATTSSAVVKNALGATVKIVRGTKSSTKTATSDSYKVSVKGGSGSVKVYVNGVLVATKK